MQGLPRGEEFGDYDLVITDIDMPRMNGFELTSQIKSHAKLKQIPVIIVSYKDREEDRIQGLEAGADYYLTKSSFHDDTFRTYAHCHIFLTKIVQSQESKVQKP